MSSFVEKLAASGQLTSEQVERIGQNVAAFRRAAEDDPSLQKEAAGLFEHIDWKQTAGSAIALTGLHALQGVAGDAVRQIKGSVSKARDYKSMMDVNPHLAEHDSTQVQRIFGTLHRFNPQYAADPLVAGAFVKNTLESARMDMNSLNQIVQSRKNLSEAYAKEQGPNLGDALQIHDPMQMARDQEMHSSQMDMNRGKALQMLNQEERQLHQEHRQRQEHAWKGEARQNQHVQNVASGPFSFLSPKP